MISSSAFLFLVVLQLIGCHAQNNQPITTAQTTVVVVPFTDFLRAYPEIERYLVENVADNSADDINENMQKAREYLEVLRSRPTTEQPHALIDALQKFVSLADGGQTTCDFQRYIPLYYNYLASRSSESGGSKLRVAKIVDQFGLQHAQMCTDFYGEQVRQRYAEMQLSPTIEGLLDSALRSATGPNMVHDLEQHFQHQNAPVLGSSHVQLIHAILLKQSAAEQDPDSSYLVADATSPCHEDAETGELAVGKQKYEAIGRLFERHIRGPCKSLVGKLRDVMEPAAFDVLYHPKRQQDDFYLIWARYKLCDTMSSQVRQKLIASLAQSACGAQ